MASTVKLGNGQEFVSKADYDKLAAKCVDLNEKSDSKLNRAILAERELGHNKTLIATEIQRVNELKTQLNISLREIGDLHIENANMRTFIINNCYVYVGDGSDISDSYIDANESSWMPATPATDAAIAELKARGVEELARTLNSETIEGSSMVMVAKTFAAQLRAGVAK